MTTRQTSLSLSAKSATNNLNPQNVTPTPTTNLKGCQGEAYTTCNHQHQTTTRCCKVLQHLLAVRAGSCQASKSSKMLVNDGEMLVNYNEMSI